MSSSPITPPAAEFYLPPTSAGVSRVRDALGRGQLVVLPTETVYGIAVNLHNSAAREAARAFKAEALSSVAGGRGGEPSVPAPWVVHVATPDDLLSWVPHLSGLGKRLIGKALPGPVSFQIRIDAADEPAVRERLGAAASETLVGGYLTLRCPDMPPTQGTLDSLPFPVAIIGAGTASMPAVFEAQDLPASLMNRPNGPQFALDAGPTRYRKPSTLVRIDGERFAVVRPGVIDERIISKMADFTILFLCSGNTCRSPMASALAAKFLADKLHIAPSELPLRHIVVQSAGLHAGRGMRAALEAMDAVKEYGADLSSHISQPATPELLRRADVIYTMTNAHRDEVLDMAPGAEHKTFSLDPSGDIADPIGSSLSVYQQVASRLSDLISHRLSELSV